MMIYSFYISVPLLITSTVADSPFLGAAHTLKWNVYCTVRDPLEFSIVYKHNPFCFDKYFKIYIWFGKLAEALVYYFWVEGHTYGGRGVS